jgi:hypothetical protein
LQALELVQDSPARACGERRTPSEVRVQDDGAMTSDKPSPEQQLAAIDPEAAGQVIAAP